jgi:hypothetical protein
VVLIGSPTRVLRTLSKRRNRRLSQKRRPGTGQVGVWPGLGSRERWHFDIEKRRSGSCFCTAFSVSAPSSHSPMMWTSGPRSATGARGFDRGARHRRLRCESS